jgi:hypothetical protein
MFDYGGSATLYVSLITSAGWFVGYFGHVLTMSAFQRFGTSPFQMFSERNGSAFAVAFLLLFFLSPALEEFDNKSVDKTIDEQRNKVTQQSKEIVQNAKKENTATCTNENILTRLDLNCNLNLLEIPDY